MGVACSVWFAVASLPEVASVPALSVLADVDLEFVVLVLVALLSCVVDVLFAEDVFSDELDELLVSLDLLSLDGTDSEDESTMLDEVDVRGAPSLEPVAELTTTLVAPKASAIDTIANGVKNGGVR